MTAKVTEEEELAKQQKRRGVDTVKVETEEKKAERDALKLLPRLAQLRAKLLRRKEGRKEINSKYIKARFSNKRWAFCFNQ